MLIHVVKQGEELFSIARTYGVGSREIANLNELPDPNRVLVGQALIIPTTDQISGQNHTVAPGETLWKIAQKYGTTVDALVRLNNIANPSLLYPGQVLKVASAGLTPPSPQTHIVKSGETLWKIAQQYNVTTQALISANNIKDPNLIYPGTSLVIPGASPLPPSRPSIEVNAYIYDLGRNAIGPIQEVGKDLTYLAPFTYGIEPDGTLIPAQDEEAIQAARAQRAVPMMCINNFTAQQAGSSVAHTVMADPAITERLLANVLSTMKAKGYRGLNIDFENVLQADRQLYNQFVQRAVDRLHPEGFFVSTALAPKTSGEMRGLLYEAHDYPAHGRIADFVVLMTYEWGYRKGPPQAISPFNQIKRVLDYAVSVMPRNKIFLGFQIYARDWTLPHVQGNEAETFSPQEAVRRAYRYNVTIQYDKATESPFFRYTDSNGTNHEVWFEDARSAQAKFDAVKEYNLRGVSYWALGYPYPQNWRLLESNFNIIKKA